jgi:hypothetical protein
MGLIDLIKNLIKFLIGLVDLIKNSIEGGLIWINLQ